MKKDYLLLGGGALVVSLYLYKYKTRDFLSGLGPDLAIYEKHRRNAFTKGYEYKGSMDYDNILKEISKSIKTKNHDHEIYEAFFAGLDASNKINGLSINDIIKLISKLRNLKKPKGNYRNTLVGLHGRHPKYKKTFSYFQPTDESYEVINHKHFVLWFIKPAYKHAYEGAYKGLQLKDILGETNPDKIIPNNKTKWFNFLVYFKIGELKGDKSKIPELIKELNKLASFYKMNNPDSKFIEGVIDYYK